MAAAIGAGVLRQHVEHWLKAKRVPPEHCSAVFSLTKVPLWELRPDDWFRIWPMLIGTYGAPAVPEQQDQAAGAPKKGDTAEAHAAARPVLRLPAYRERHQDKHCDKPTSSSRPPP